jgi:hypothetical protein
MLGVPRKITTLAGAHVGTLLVDVDETGAQVAHLTVWEPDPPTVMDVSIRRGPGREGGDYVIVEVPGDEEIGKLWIQGDGSATLRAPGLFSEIRTHVER